MNITYLLGAGSSANTIPVVEKTHLRLKYFLYILEEFGKEHRFKSSIGENFPGRISIYKELYEKVILHLSYDTFAKKLWLQGNISELNYLKELISIFYFFEHFPATIKKSFYNGFHSKCSPDEKDEMKIILSTFGDNRCDKRYDAFIAGIANWEDNRVSCVPRNINIVSWNYDIQLEMALEEYVKKNFEHSFNPTIKPNPQNLVNNKIVKLNGSCGYNLVTDNNGLLQENERGLRPYFKEIRDTSLEDIANIINGFVYSEPLLVRPYINFAWEENHYSKITVKMAQDIFENTDGLVIIGYSFPLFNRRVDSLLFSNLKIADNSKIYILTISEQEFLRIKSRIQGIKQFKDNEIEYIPDINQFYVPFELNERKSIYSPNMSGYNYEDL